MGVTQARATSTVVDYWRMGENDSGAVAGQTATSTKDAVGGRTITFANSPDYSGRVSLFAAAHTGSDLCLQMAGNAGGTASAIPSLVNNFCLEMWVNPSTNTGSQCLAYNGNTGSSGWGLYQQGATFTVLFGGVAFVPISAPLTAGSWVHLALVRNNGTNTIYTNGVAAASTTSDTPQSPVGNFLIGENNSGGESFSGSMDEVRVFTFTAGAFSTNDLLINQPALGAASLTEGPASGQDGVTLMVTPAGSAWTATANASWLHLLHSSGNGKTNVLFTFDANSGITRTGTLTIAGRTLTVTQAGSTYVPAGVITLVSSGLTFPFGVAVDGVGNVYIADTYDSQLKEWVAASQTVTNFLSVGGTPWSVTVDSAGNLYYTVGEEFVLEWVAASGTVTNLVTLDNDPYAVGVDSAGDVYFSLVGYSPSVSIDDWVAVSKTTSSFQTDIDANGLAVDISGNVYFDNTLNNSVEEWVAASNAVITLAELPGGSGALYGVAVDGAGNVYIADTPHAQVKEWVAANNTVTILSSNLNAFGLAVDGKGNVYISGGNGNYANTVDELPRAFVVSMPRFENALAGNDALAAVVPTNASLTGPFTPGSDSSWLTITGITNGVVSYAFTANTANTNRTAHITLLGQSIPITQSSSFFLGATNLVEGPAAGTDSVVLATGAANTWTATANSTWLHLASGYETGTGSTNVVFSFDANSGPTRTGAITIANQTLTVVQAGSGYVAAGVLTAIPEFTQPQTDQPAVAVDGVGNVYVSDEINESIDEWNPGNTGASSNFTGVIDPLSVAADQAGNLYIADYNGFLEKASVASARITTLSSYLMGGGNGYGVALDGADNVYIADTYSNVVSKWSVADQAVGILISSGLNQPSGVAVDAAGNLYIADTGSQSIKKWTAATARLSPLVTGLNTPVAVAVDGSGNVYIADSGAGVIDKWSAGSSRLSTLINGLDYPTGLTVDALGNVYVAIYSAGYPVRELPRAFVDTTTRYESAGSGTDSLPAVLPDTESLVYPFAPGINQSPAWIAASSTNHGVVGFSFGANSGNSSVRTAQYYLYGQPTEIIQQWVIAPHLLRPVLAANGGVQFSFTNNQSGATFTVLSTTNVSLPLDAWTVTGTATNIGSGVYQFTSQPITNTSRIFYSVSSP